MTYRLKATRVGVIGSGVVGQTLAAGFASRGHDVMLGSRDPGKDDVRAWLESAGDGVSAGTFADTAEHGELLVRLDCERPFGSRQTDAANSVAPGFAGRNGTSLKRTAAVGGVRGQVLLRRSDAGSDLARRQ